MNPNSPTYTGIVISRAGGVTWVATAHTEAHWYFHHAENEVFPMSARERLHPGHAITPVKPAT
jgi:hypothetical protein